MIRVAEVRNVVERGGLVEDYPEDLRGHSCLILGYKPEMILQFMSFAHRRMIAPFHVDRKGYHITLDRIPAWVCAQCGEVYFDDPEVEAIQEVLCTLDQRTEKMAKSA